MLQRGDNPLSKQGDDNDDNDETKDDDKEKIVPESGVMQLIKI